MAINHEVADRLVEWVKLGHRLLQASPQRWDEIFKHVRLLVEGQEVIASADRQLVLRRKRPEKRYRG